MSRRLLLSSSVTEDEGPDKAGVRLSANRPHPIVGQPLKRVRKNELTQPCVALDSGDLLSDRHELLSDDDHGWLLQLLDENRVVDTPRRA